ncbi:MAG TPA: hypothetical protein VFS42_06865 [Burkholderiaceae bacterium]|nr:hypothetical protein [Burkholderiaceae bacterium]
MAVAAAIPIIVGAAGAAAATTTLAMVASVASIISGVAAMTGNSDLAKIAGFVSLGAGIANLATGMANASATVTEEALKEGAEKSITEGMLAGSRGNTAIAAGTATADASGAAGGAAVADNAASTTTVAEAANTGASAQSAATATPVMDAGMVADATTNAGTAASNTGSIASVADVVKPGGGTFMDSLKQFGTIIKDNKEAVNLAGGALDGAFGPQARQVSLLEEKLKAQREQEAIERANANNVVNLRTPFRFNPNARVTQRS